MVNAETATGQDGVVVEIYDMNMNRRGRATTAGGGSYAWEAWDSGASDFIGDNDDAGDPYYVKPVLEETQAATPRNAPPGGARMPYPVRPGFDADFTIQGVQVRFLFQGCAPGTLVQVTRAPHAPEPAATNFNVKTSAVAAGVADRRGQARVEMAPGSGYFATLYRPRPAGSSGAPYTRIPAGTGSMNLDPLTSIAPGLSLTCTCGENIACR